MSIPVEGNWFHKTLEVLGSHEMFPKGFWSGGVYESSVIFLLAQFKSIHWLFSLIKVSSDFSTEIKSDA